MSILSLRAFVCAAHPFGERFLLQEQMPCKEMPFVVRFNDERPFLHGAVGQANVVVGTLHFLLMRCGMPRSGWMGLGFSFVMCIFLSFG